jgi:hypothetical protein
MKGRILYDLVVLIHTYIYLGKITYMVSSIIATVFHGWGAVRLD